MAAKKVKSTIRPDLEASQRLDIHATMMNRDRAARELNYGAFAPNRF